MRKVLVCLVLMLFLSVSATALKFQASLTTIRIVALPGQLFTRHFILTLDKSEKRAQFRAHTEDWWRSEDGKQSFFKPAGTLLRGLGQTQSRRDGRQRRGNARYSPVHCGPCRNKAGRLLVCTDRR